MKQTNWRSSGPSTLTLLARTRRSRPLRISTVRCASWRPAKMLATASSTWLYLHQSLQLSPPISRKLAWAKRERYSLSLSLSLSLSPCPSLSLHPNHTHKTHTRKVDLAKRALGGWRQYLWGTYLEESIFGGGAIGIGAGNPMAPIVPMKPIPNLAFSLYSEYFVLTKVLIWYRIQQSANDSNHSASFICNIGAGLEWLLRNRLERTLTAQQNWASI